MTPIISTTLNHTASWGENVFKMIKYYQIKHYCHDGTSFMVWLTRNLLTPVFPHFVLQTDFFSFGKKRQGIQMETEPTWKPRESGWLRQGTHPSAGLSEKGVLRRQKSHILVWSLRDPPGSVRVLPRFPAQGRADSNIPGDEKTARRRGPGSCSLYG